MLARHGRDFFKALPLAMAGDSGAIHDMRVAGRRLRIAIRILSHRPEGRHANRADRLLRDLIRTAGACRDQDVSISLLEAELEAGGARSADAKRLLGRLRAARAFARHRMTEALLDQDLRTLRRELRAVLRRASSKDSVALAQALSESARLASGAAGEINAILTALKGRYEAAPLHTVRTRLRRLRYAAEITGRIAGGTATRDSDLRATQGHLGVLHDTHVLAAWLSRQAMRTDALARTAASLSRRFRRMSGAAHRAFEAGAPLQLVHETRATIEAAGRNLR